MKRLSQTQNKLISHIAINLKNKYRSWNSTQQGRYYIRVFFREVLHLDYIAIIA